MKGKLYIMCTISINAELWLTQTHLQTWEPSGKTLCPIQAAFLTHINSMCLTSPLPYWEYRHSLRTVISSVIANLDQTVKLRESSTEFRQNCASIVTGNRISSLEFLKSYFFTTKERKNPKSKNNWFKKLLDT